jgi:hypothetical protein
LTAAAAPALTGFDPENLSGEASAPAGWAVLKLGGELRAGGAGRQGARDSPRDPDARARGTYDAVGIEVIVVT